MKFNKYQHIERFGTSEVEGIEFGKCYIFYKIDGTNSSVWLGDDNEIHAGSRRRDLTLENDNAGFYNYISEQKNIKDYLTKHPNHRLFGEWLVPHSLKTYREEAWRKFYVFDVCDERMAYLPFDDYAPMLDEFKIEYIPPIATIKNPTYESLISLLEKTGQFLIKDGEGNGEGIVIKNYQFFNKFSRQTWAKIVSNEFKERHVKAMGSPEIKAKIGIENKIIDDFCTSAFIEKEFAKIVNDKGGWSSKNTGMLLGKCFHELVTENSWEICKKYKYPTVNYKRLNSLMIQKIKEIKSEVF